MAFRCWRMRLTSRHRGPPEGSCACKVVAAEIRVKIIAIAAWRVIGLIVGTPVSSRDEDFEDGFSQAPLKGLINPEQTATLLCAKRAGESDRSGIISGSENSGFADLSQSQEERTRSSCTRRSHHGNLCAKLGDLEKMGVPS